MEQRQSSGADVDRLIEAIDAKLKAKKAVLADSLEFGRLTWRKGKNGGFVIKVQAEI